MFGCAGSLFFSLSSYFHNGILGRDTAITIAVKFQLLGD
jgi:hypothetical protein